MSARDHVYRNTPERDLQDTIVQFAGARGHLVFHDFDSRRNSPGFPDLVIVRPPFVRFRELKAETGHMSQSQLQWAKAIEACEFVDFALWKPRDLTAALEELR